MVTCAIPPHKKPTPAVYFDFLGQEIPAPLYVWISGGKKTGYMYVCLSIILMNALLFILIRVSYPTPYYPHMTKYYQNVLATYYQILPNTSKYYKNITNVVKM